MIILWKIVVIPNNLIWHFYFENLLYFNSIFKWLQTFKKIENIDT